MKDSERKRKLELLLERNKLRTEEKDTNVLFEECLVALGSDVIVLDDKKSKEIYRKFEREFKVTFYGQIEWDLYKEHEKIDENTFKKRYRDQEERYYILWSHGSDPVIEVTMDQIVRSLDD
jgi:hypothetical protein